jgi:hypothetical protein
MVLDGGYIIFHDGMYVLCVFFPGKWEDEGKEKGSVNVERRHTGSWIRGTPHSAHVPLPNT